MESEDVLPLLILIASYASFISCHMFATNLKKICHASEQMFDRIKKWNKPIALIHGLLCDAWQYYAGTMYRAAWQMQDSLHGLCTW